MGSQVATKMHIITLQKRFSDEGVQLEAGYATGAQKAKVDVSRFQRSLLLSMKDCVGNHIAHARACVNL